MYETISTTFEEDDTGYRGQRRSCAPSLQSLKSQKQNNKQEKSTHRMKKASNNASRERRRH